MNARLELPTSLLVVLRDMSGERTNEFDVLRAIARNFRITDYSRREREFGVLVLGSIAAISAKRRH